MTVSHFQRQACSNLRKLVSIEGSMRQTGYSSMVLFQDILAPISCPVNNFALHITKREHFPLLRIDTARPMICIAPKTVLHALRCKKKKKGISLTWTIYSLNRQCKRRIRQWGNKGSDTCKAFGSRKDTARNVSVWYCFLFSRDLASLTLSQQVMWLLSLPLRSSSQGDGDGS